MTKLKWRPIKSAPKDKWLLVIYHHGKKGMARLSSSDGRWQAAFMAEAPNIKAAISILIPDPQYWLDAPDPPKSMKKVTR